MTILKGKKFVASFSGGKDSTFAIYRAIQDGLVPYQLITTYNKDMGRSWVHGLTESVLERLSELIEIPFHLIESTSENYAKQFEEALIQFKSQGVEVCVFGDIDIEENRRWCEDRCKVANIQPYFPLWQQNRKSIVSKFIDSGFETMITVIDTKQMPITFLGKNLTNEVAEQIENVGADVCGENGEFHTFVYNGPLFKKQLAFETGDALTIGQYHVLPII